MKPRFRNAALLYNPLAGGLRWGRGRDLQRAVALLESYGIKVTLVETTGPGSAIDLTRGQLAAGRDLIIACGGDGTVNEVANGLAGSAVPLAVLPTGTANILAKELELSWDIWRAAEYIPDGVVRRIALGRAGDRYFVCVAGAGADANIVYHLGRRSGAHLGMLTYWLEALRQLFRYGFPEFTVEVGGELLRTTLVIVSRTRHYGGPIQITRRADLFGDGFEICTFPRRFPPFYLVYFCAQLVGMLERFPEVQFRLTQSLCARPDGRRIYSQVDGELADPLPVDFTIVPEALSLLVPNR